MNSCFIGGILLIVGTSIGGGMLALPVVNSAIGFWQSTFFLLLCWIIMTLGALFILEANLYLPRGSNMISMSIATLGIPGMVVAWLSYLLLLYTLLAAYISGGADLFAHMFNSFGIIIPQWLACLLFTLAFGCVAYSGIRQVDLLNRGLMLGKLAIYSILIIVVSPYLKSYNFIEGSPYYITSVMTILISSFGFAIIVPNLRDYFNNDIKTLRQVIWIGSLIPLLCYIAWDAVIIGSIGVSKLSTLIASSHTNSDLAIAIATTINNGVISTLFNFFSSICMLTAFLGVSLCLLSFLADGLNVIQKGYPGLALFVVTFLPPVFLVIKFPGIYLNALNYAGICCIILLLLLPSLMTVFGRKTYYSAYQVAGGKFSQALVIVASLFLLLNSVYQLLV